MPARNWLLARDDDSALSFPLWSSRRATRCNRNRNRRARSVDAAQITAMGTRNAARPSGYDAKKRNATHDRTRHGSTEIATAPSSFWRIGRSRKWVTRMAPCLGGPLITGDRVLGIRCDGGSTRGRMGSRHSEAKDELRPPALLAFHADRATMGTHDSKGHRQAESRSLAGRLRCEERLKDASLNGPGDAGSVVFDRELDEIVALGDRLHVDPPAAAGLHGLFGVEDEIHQDLLDLVGAAMNERQVLRNRGFERDLVEAQLVMEDRPGILDHLVERDGFGLQVLLSREFQQIVNDRAAPLRFFLEDREGSEERIVGGERTRCELDHALDSGERVLHLVGDPRAELAEGRHFLRLDQLCLGLLQGLVPAMELRRHLIERAGQLSHLVTAGHGDLDVEVSLSDC